MDDRVCELRRNWLVCPTYKRLGMSPLNWNSTITRSRIVLEPKDSHTIN